MSKVEGLGEGKKSRNQEVEMMSSFQSQNEEQLQHDKKKEN